MGKHSFCLAVAMIPILTSGCSWITSRGSDGLLTPTNKTMFWLDGMLDEGKYSEAEAELADRLQNTVGSSYRETLVALEIVRRAKRDFSLTRDQLVNKIAKDIPDVTDHDIHSWAENGYVQHRNIDGTVFYFRREPLNLYRFCDDARSRRDAHRPHPAYTQQFPFPMIRASWISRAEQSGRLWLLPRQHRLEYKIKINDYHPLIKKGAKVRCWLPYPQDYGYQTDVRLISSSPSTPRISPNGHAQRTAFFGHTIEDPRMPVEFSIVCEFVTFVYYPKLDAAKVQPYYEASELYKRYTAERLPHIEFLPEVQSIVANLSKDQDNPLTLARDIFLWVDENIADCVELEYSTIRSLTAKGLKTRRGDSGVKAMTFISLCRAAGIPARWQSGWQTEPCNERMHAWAEIYVEPWGWIPADPGYGTVDGDSPNVRNFYFGHSDSFRMIFNLDYARQFDPPTTDFRSDPVDSQVGEVEIDGKNLFYDEWEWTCSISRYPHF